MYVLEDEEITHIHDFLILSGMGNFCEVEDNYEAFRDETFRFRDMIRAFDNCPITAADAYKKAKELASVACYAAYNKAKNSNNNTNANEQAFNTYCEVMKKQFYNKLIQYRWQEVNEYRKQTSVLCQARYRDYLSVLDVSSYVEYYI